MQLLQVLVSFGTAVAVLTRAQNEQLLKQRRAQRLQLQKRGYNLPAYDSPVPQNGTGYPKRLPAQVVPVTGPIGQYDLFANSTAHDKYRVTQLPLIDFPIDVSYAGRLPLLADDPEQREFGFWYFPQRQHGRDYHSRTLTIWLNGGPGASSLIGMLQEAGPVLWLPGDLYPSSNMWSFTNLTDVLYVDQPVGTGYTSGKYLKTTQLAIAEDFGLFLDAFFAAFPGLDTYKLLGVGESYAGTYLPFIADHLNTRPLAEGEKRIQMSKIWLISPAIDDGSSHDLATISFLERQQGALGLDNIDLYRLRHLADVCGITEFVRDNYKFPGRPMSSYGSLSAARNTSATSVCAPSALWSLAFALAVQRLGGAGSTYDVLALHTPTDDVLSEADDPATAGKVLRAAYFDRSDVKQALHMPADLKWRRTAFVVNNTADSADGSGSSGSWQADVAAWSALPRVIEASEVVVLSNGAEDFQISFEATRIAVQNMTWGNATGFSSPVMDRFLVGPDLGLHQLKSGLDLSLAPFDSAEDDGWSFSQTRAGFWQEERGLRHVLFKRAGHMTPADAPLASYSFMDWFTDGLPELDYRWDWEYDPDYLGPQPEFRLEDVELPEEVKPWGIWRP